MKAKVLLSGIAFTAISLAAPVGFQSFTPVLTGGTVANFEGFTEFTTITTQYAGMSFTQTGGGSPWIDNYNQNLGGNGCSGSGWCYGYGASSGSGVLTGSTAGGNVVTTAGIIDTFTSLQADVQAFLSDTSPLGNYTITAYSGANATGTLLGTVTVNALGGAGLPPGYSGGLFPAPGTTPLPGVFVGFTDTVAEIKSIQIGPSSVGAGSDAFAVDDIRIVPLVTTTPEPASLVFLGAGLIGLASLRRKRERRD